MVENLTIKYAEEFSYTDNHVNQYKDSNDIYRLTIYINSNCISDLNLKIPKIDFGNCYQLVENNNLNQGKNIIISIFDKKIEGTIIRKIIFHGMFHNPSGLYLNPNELCKEEKITFVESLEEKLLSSGIKVELYQEMSKEGIDLFDISSPFYNDVCFQYNSEKDIALRDRILVYFPNISLCDENCELKGVNMTTLESKCECIFKDTQNKNYLKENALVKSQVGDIEELLSSINIYLLKCSNLLIKTKYTVRCYGGLIIIFLIIIQIICSIIYFSMNIFHINNYIFGIINNYLNYIKPEAQNKDIKAKTINHNNDQNNAPPKANHNKNNINKQMNNSKDNDKSIRVVKKKSKTYKKNISFYINKNKASKNIPEEKISEKDNINSKNDIIKERNSLKQNSVNNISSSKGVFLKEIGEYQNHFNNYNNNEFDLINNIELEMDINFEEYLETELEQMDYFDAIKRDERKFCKIFSENLMNNQMIINIFCINEPLKPRPIKLFLLILQIDLYLFVNGLFFNEEYISKIYHTKKETFSTVLERFSENLLYATLVGVIISYIIEFFFYRRTEIKEYP